MRGQTAFPPQIEQRLVSTASGPRLDGDPDGSPLDQLTPRELDVLRLLASGLSVKECAIALERSTSTVDNHKSRIMKKLGIHRSVDLTRLAIREGLVSG